jgi:ethanolamine utilization protein EutQ (cupin superfamily)
VHDRDDECFYALDGALSVRPGGEAFDAAAGSFVFLPHFREINAASGDDERTRIGERYGIRVVPG